MGQHSPSVGKEGKRGAAQFREQVGKKKMDMLTEHKIYNLCGVV